jgi:hypothetical protein
MEEREKTSQENVLTYLPVLNATTQKNGSPLQFSKKKSAGREGHLVVLSKKNKWACPELERIYDLALTWPTQKVPPNVCLLSYVCRTDTKTVSIPTRYDSTLVAEQAACVARTSCDAAF